jgi:hypothetical protein
MFSKDEYREFFIREFEADSDWANVLNAGSLLSKKQRICQTSGFCAEDSFEYERDEDDGWGSDQCFVCHAVMEDLEVRYAQQHTQRMHFLYFLLSVHACNTKYPVLCILTRKKHLCTMSYRKEIALELRKLAAIIWCDFFTIFPNSVPTF